MIDLKMHGENVKLNTGSLKRKRLINNIHIFQCIIVAVQQRDVQKI